MVYSQQSNKIFHIGKNVSKSNFMKVQVHESSLGVFVLYLFIQSFPKTPSLDYALTSVFVQNNKKVSQRRKTVSLKVSKLMVMEGANHWILKTFEKLYP